MNTNDNVAIALSQRLQTYDPSIFIQFPNEAAPPDADVYYLSVAFLRGQPENPAVGPTMERHVGVLQVNVHYPVNTGEGPARRVADALAALFPVGDSMTYGGVTVRVMQTAAAAQGFHDGAWYVVPVSVFYQADVF